MAKQKRTVVYIGTGKTECENVATGYRRSLRQRKLPYIGKVKVVKSGKNFSVVHYGDLPKGVSRAFMGPRVRY